MTHTHTIRDRADALVVIAFRDIKEGEEVRASYGDFRFLCAPTKQRVTSLRESH